MAQDKIIHLRSADPKQHVAMCDVDVSPSREWLRESLSRHNDDVAAANEAWPHSISKFPQHVTCPACLAAR